MYCLTENPDAVRHMHEDRLIPRGHRWWTEYEAWLAEGNVPAAVEVTHHDDICARARGQRDLAISGSVWLVERHNGQMRLDAKTSLSENQFAELLAYHQALRDWPSQPGWPDIDMPPEPDWLTELKK